MTINRTENLNSFRSETNGRLERARKKADEGLSDKFIDSAADVQRLLDNVRQTIDRAETPNVCDQMHFVDRAIKSEWQKLHFAAGSLIASERQVTDSALGSERDESDRDSERARVTQAETEVSLDAISQFVAIVSHDLKNPLGAISMSAMLIERYLEAGDLDVNRLRSAIAIIKRNSIGMDRMISDLLDVQRIKFGKLNLNRTRIQVISLLSECLEMFGEIAARKSIKLEILNEIDPSVVYDFDHDRILQALANLVGNALKFTQAGGAISLSVEQTGSDIRIYVRDNGPGISKDLMPHLFDRFSQGSRSNRTGLGLGLHISKAIVESHGGKIWANSTQGEGTEFVIMFPPNQAKIDHLTFS